MSLHVECQKKTAAAATERPRHVGMERMDDELGHWNGGRKVGR